MKRIFFFILLIFFVFIVACTPYKKISTETIEPARINVPAEVNKIGFMFSEPTGKFAVDNTNKLKLQINEELKRGIADIAAASPRFRLSSLHVLNDSELTKNVPENQYPKRKINRMANDSLDAIIVLHSFHLKDSLDEEIVFDNRNYYYYLFNLKSKALWRFYVPTSKDFVIDVFNYSEKFAWESIDYTKQKALNKLPDYSKTYHQAAYWTAVDYLKRIAPLWKSEERIIFDRGNKLFKQAYEAFQNKNWEKAILLWKKNKGHEDNELSSRALHNIAVTSELMGRIDIALTWAKKSYKVKPKPRTKEYIQRLKERQSDVKKLEKQMPYGLPD